VPRPPAAMLEIVRGVHVARTTDLADAQIGEGAQMDRRELLALARAATRTLRDQGELVGYLATVDLLTRLVWDAEAWSKASTGKVSYGQGEGAAPNILNYLRGPVRS
jgi:hypothetical protein